MAMGFTADMSRLASAVRGGDDSKMRAFFVMVNSFGGLNLRDRLLSRFLKLPESSERVFRAMAWSYTCDEGDAEELMLRALPERDMEYRRLAHDSYGDAGGERLENLIELMVERNDSLYLSYARDAAVRTALEDPDRGVAGLLTLAKAFPDPVSLGELGMAAVNLEASVAGAGKPVAPFLEHWEQLWPNEPFVTYGRARYAWERGDKPEVARLSVKTIEKAPSHLGASYILTVTRHGGFWRSEWARAGAQRMWWEALRAKPAV